MKKFIFFLFAGCWLGLKGQPSGTSGTEFWLTYTENINYVHSTFIIYISAFQNSLVTISNPNTSFTKTISATAGSLIIDSIPISECYNQGSGNVLNKGIKVSATSEIALYASNQTWGSNDASAILPVSTLGLRYRVMSYRATLENYPTFSEFGILSTQDGTIINITPNALTRDGKFPGTSYSIILNKGQTYQVAAANYTSDLTGSLIEVQNCKPIAVFGDCSISEIHCYSAGNLYEQLFPINTWGKEFILIPTASKTKDAFVLVADKSNTTFRLNGGLITLANAGDKYDGEISAPSYITSDKPVCVCMYGMGQQCSGNTGNGFMMWISPAEQKVKETRFCTITSSVNPIGLTRFYVNIIVRTTTKGSVKLDGNNISSAFTTINYNTNYSYAKIAISDSIHAITADSGFLAYTYGYGQGGGYGFNTGSSNRELERYFTINTIKNDDYGPPSQAPHFCKNSSITFKGYSSNYTPVFWHWQFGNTSANTQNVTKTFSDTGLIRVMLITGRYNSLCTSDTALDTSFQYIRIVTPYANILTSDTSVCVGSLLHVRVTFSDDSPILWRSDPDLSCEKCPEPLIMPTTSKWYKVTLGGGTMGCSVSDSIHIHVIDTIHFKASYDTIVCQRDSTTIFSAILNPDTLTTYTFSLFDSNSMLMQNSTGTFKLSPDTSTSFTVKINNGCSDVLFSFHMKVIPQINLKYTVDVLYPKCVNSNLQLSATTNYNDSIIFIWGDGTDTVVNGNAHTLAHTYSITGMKTVSIKAIANQCMDSFGFAFMVRLPIQILTSNDTTVCKGTFANLRMKATGADSIFSYLLKTPGSTLNSSNGSFYLVPDSTTTFSIGAVNICAGDTIWKPITVTVRPPLNLKLNTKDTTICKGNVFAITATATGGMGRYDYFLKKNNIVQQTNTTGIFNITVNTNEIYNVVVTDNCTVLNDSLTCNIKIFTTLQFTKPLPDLFLCSGVPTSLKAQTNLGSGKVTYIWTDAASNTTLAITDSLVLTPFASQKIIIKVTDACTSIFDTVDIFVFATANGTQLSTDVTSGCVPLTVNFETPPLNYSNNMPCEALWDFGDGGTLVQAFDNTFPVLKAKHTYVSPGVYPVNVAVKFKGNTVPCLTFNTVVEALSISQVKITIEPKKITLPKTQCTAIVTTFNADSVVIDWGDGFSDNFNTNLNAFTQTHDFSDTGHYTVKATAYNKNTCYTETYTSVYHADTFMCFIPNAFTPNKDGTNETFKPVVNFCKSYELVIYNRWGEEVFKANYYAGKNQPPVWTGEGSPMDTYIYKFTATDGDRVIHNYKGTVMLLR